MSEVKPSQFGPDIQSLAQSEKRFRLLADSAPVLIWISDTTKGCVWFNKPWLRFTGRLLEQECGNGWADGVHPDDFARCLDIYVSCFDARKPFSMEYRLRRHDQQWRWILDNGVPLFDEGGEFTGYIGSCIDINDQKVVEGDLIEARDRLELSVDAAELGTFFCPMPLGPVVWNDKCKEHFFLPADAQVDFDLFYSRLHSDDREPVRLAVERTVNQGQPYDVQYRTVAPEGYTRWIRAKGKAYYGVDGKPVRFDGITIDITEAKKLEHERMQLLDAERAARSEAERVSRMKDEFLTTLSHELRTPLTAILGWSHLLRRDGISAEEVKQGLMTIERNARVQTQLIEDLLDMSRIAAGKVRLDIQSTDLLTVVDAAIETIRPSAQSKGIQIHKHLESQTPMVAADAARLQQVVGNLLSNAVKFTPRGGRIDLALGRVADQAQITVKDSGKGIDPAFLPHVFERFRQADASTTRKYGGLGLGLAIVKQLVDMHSGTVTAQSPAEGGALFIVALPVPSRPESQSDSSSNAIPISDVGLGPIRGVEILVVDDEPDTRELVERLLLQCEARVLTAGSANEALEILKTSTPQLILSDIGMPECDGYEFIRQVRKLAPSQGGTIPAIALTAFARSEDRTRAMMAGYQIHIPKPIDPQELVVTIASLLGRTRQRENSGGN